MPAFGTHNGVGGLQMSVEGKRWGVGQRKRHIRGVLSTPRTSSTHTLSIGTLASLWEIVSVASTKLP